MTTNAFTYNGGNFSGRLVALGTAVFNADFTAGNGMLISSALTLAAGRTLMLNGAGLANEGTLTFAGGTLGGSGPLANNSLITGNGMIAGSGGFANNGLITQSGGNLTLTNSGATGANAGRVNLLGGTLSFAQQFTNFATGQINGEGALYFPTTPVPSSGSPTAGLMNAGNINLTGGDSQICIHHHWPARRDHREWRHREQRHANANDHRGNHAQHE